MLPTKKAIHESEAACALVCVRSASLNIVIVFKTLTVSKSVSKRYF